MAEHTTPFRNARSESGETFERLRAEVDRFVDEFDLQAVAARIEDFGREKPLVLAAAALTVGLAVGFLLKKRGKPV